MSRRRTEPEFLKSPKNKIPVIRGASWHEEIERTRPIVDKMVPFRKLLSMYEGRDFKHEKPFGFAKRDGRNVMLNLDTDKDKLVAEMVELHGCFGHSTKTAYYVHKDDAGTEHFYKTGSEKQGDVTWSMRGKMHEYLNDVELDITDDGAVEETKKGMLLALGSQILAERITGTRVMPKKGVLRDFARLGEHEGINIHYEGLERDHTPRPTHRWFGGTPSDVGLLLHDMEEELYWSRLKKREPIPLDVWEFLEAVHSDRLDENPLWKEYARKHLE